MAVLVHPFPHLVGLFLWMETGEPRSRKKMEEDTFEHSTVTPVNLMKRIERCASNHIHATIIDQAERSQQL